MSDSQKQQFEARQIQPGKESYQPAPPTPMPWWRHSGPGYGLAFLIILAFTGVTLLGEHLLHYYYFPSSASLLVGILCVALFWGVGPGLLATTLSSLSLIYIYLFPVDKVGITETKFSWEFIFPVILFAISGLTVVILIEQRESARRRALQAEQLARTQAADLASINQELHRANQFKDLFVSITSHELKTPITTIRGQAQLALRRLRKQVTFSPELDNLREAFMKVDEQTSRLTNLLNDLLDLSSLRAGKRVLVKKICDLNEICTNVVEEQRQLSGRAIELQLLPEPLQLQADARRLGQVCTNLVSNALKYSPQDSVVRVQVQHTQSRACFSVEDAGEGIPPEQQESIFQPFYRTTQARTSAVEGTGLGLAICKDIVEHHQGRIWCESSPGAGSIFYVDLPRYQSAH